MSAETPRLSEEREMQLVVLLTEHQNGDEFTPSAILRKTDLDIINGENESLATDKLNELIVVFQLALSSFLKKNPSQSTEEIKATLLEDADEDDLEALDDLEGDDGAPIDIASLANMMHEQGPRMTIDDITIDLVREIVTQMSDTEEDEDGGNNGNNISYRMKAIHEGATLRASDSDGTRTKLLEMATLTSQVKELNNQIEGLRRNIEDENAESAKSNS